MDDQTNQTPGAVVPPVDPAVGQVPAADPGAVAPVGGGTWDPNQGGNSGTPTGTV